MSYALTHDKGQHGSTKLELNVALLGAIATVILGLSGSCGMQMRNNLQRVEARVVELKTILGGETQPQSASADVLDIKEDLKDLEQLKKFNLR